jgi:hypothetical protein
MTQWGLDVLFNPAKRHMDEEKRRLQSTREEIGDASGGKRIDLESGKVIIPRANAEDESALDDTEDAGADDETRAVENESVQNEAADNEAAHTEPTEAEAVEDEAVEDEPADTAAARARARRRELRQRQA